MCEKHEHFQSKPSLIRQVQRRNKIRMCALKGANNTSQIQQP